MTIAMCIVGSSVDILRPCLDSSFVSFHDFFLWFVLLIYLDFPELQFEAALIQLLIPSVFGDSKENNPKNALFPHLMTY